MLCVAPYIELNIFLKLKGLTQTGGQAKAFKLAKEGIFALKDVLKERGSSNF